MSIQERVAEIKILLDASPITEKFIIHPGETSWWHIIDPVERNRAYVRQWQRMWRKLHPGRKNEVQKRYNERHPGHHAEAMRKWNGSHPGCSAEAYKKYYETPKGKASYARMTANRRERSTDPELYAARVELLHIMRESCNICGTLYKVTHQIDHILALCLGGSDVWSNYQPLCILCHKKKTEEDMRKLAATNGEEICLMVKYHQDMQHGFCKGKKT